MGIELFRNESWENFCSSDWTIETGANIICSELGFPGALSATSLDDSDVCFGDIRCGRDEIYVTGCNFTENVDAISTPVGVTCHKKGSFSRTFVHKQRLHYEH